MIVVSRRQEPKNQKTTMVIFQGEIAISKNGTTSIYSPGYSGCMGLIVATVNKVGGLVAHIAESGSKVISKRHDYIRESVQLVIDVASDRLKTDLFDIALFRGWPNETGLDWGQGTDQRVRSVLDLRGLSHTSDYGNFRFNPEKRMVYLPGGYPDDAMGVTRGNTVETSSLTVPLGKKAMPILVYA